MIEAQLLRVSETASRRFGFFMRSPASQLPWACYSWIIEFAKILSEAGLCEPGLSSEKIDDSTGEEALRRGPVMIILDAGS